VLLRMKLGKDGRKLPKLISMVIDMSDVYKIYMVRMLNIQLTNLRMYGYPDNGNIIS